MDARTVRDVRRSAGGPGLAAAGADALVVATPWPEYRDVDAGRVAAAMRGTLVLDAGGFLAATLGRAPGLRYIRVGQGHA